MTDTEDDGIAVTGGAGGTRACLVALVTGAIRAERAAVHLAEAAAHASRAAATVAHTAAVSPATADRARASTAGLVTGQLGLRTRSERLHEMAAGLRGAAEAYARAEADSTSAIRAISITAGRMLGELGPGAVITTGILAVGGIVRVGELTVAARVLRYMPSPAGLALRWLGSEDNQADDGPRGFFARLVGGPGIIPEITIPSPAQLEAGLPVVAAVIDGLAPGWSDPSSDPVAEAAGLAALAARFGVVLFGVPREGLVVAPLTKQKPADRGPADVAPESIADVLREVDAVSGDSPGAVGVQRVDHADGTRSWVVAVPGTQDAGVGGATPTDMLSNFELVAGLPDDRTETVIRAMQQAGIRPDEPVLLAGHSQGGMAVVRVAAAAGDTFTIAGVVTAGSPVGAMDLPDDIPALHLEHVQDYVPASDGTANPDTLNRTTVRRDLFADGGSSASDSLADLAHAAFLEPHELSAYITTAELVAQHQDRSVTTFLEAIEPVLDDGTSEVTTVRYVGVRVPDDISTVSAPASSSPTSSCGKRR